MSEDWRSPGLPEGVTHRLLLVRHGATDRSAKGLCYGKLDIALSQTGRQQAVQTAQLIKPFKPGFVYSSPRLRAVDTAAAVSYACQLDTLIEQSLAELDFGDFEGLSYQEVEQRYPDLYKQWMKHPTKVRFPNGESYDQMSTRVIDSMSQLKMKHKGQTIVTVAHGGVNRIVLANVLMLEPEMVFRLDQSYGAVSCVDYYDETPVLRIMNWLP